MTDKHYYKSVLEWVNASADFLPSHMDKYYKAIKESLQHSIDNGWKPIETAPKDGQIVLCVWPDGCNYQISKYIINSQGRGDFWFETRGKGNHLVNKIGFTHWKPLPEPPKKKD